MDATWRVLIYSSLAAATAALGALPLASGRTPPLRLLGWANALASGLMLGVAYALMTTGLDRGTPAMGVGALAGVAFVAAAHRALGTLGALHAAHEGIAIGVAMAVGLPVGALTAVALAVHNVPEATVTIAAMTARGVRLPLAAIGAVTAKANQVLLAVVTLTLVLAAPVLLPWALGFAVGALLYLVMAELLPDSYHAAGRTSIALVTIVAVAIVVLLHDGAR